MREVHGGDWEEGIGRCGALEVLKTWCEVGTGKTPHPSDVAEERMYPCRARWDHDLSMGRTLKKLGPELYSPECVQEEFCELRLNGTSRRSLPEKWLPGIYMALAPLL